MHASKVPHGTPAKARLPYPGTPTLINCNLTHLAMPQRIEA